VVVQYSCLKGVLCHCSSPLVPNSIEWDKALKERSADQSHGYPMQKMWKIGWHYQQIQCKIPNKGTLLNGLEQPTPNIRRVGKAACVQPNLSMKTGMTTGAPIATRSLGLCCSKCCLNACMMQFYAASKKQPRDGNY
jgi:hypothetical protein